MGLRNGPVSIKYGFNVPPPSSGKVHLILCTFAVEFLSPLMWAVCYCRGRDAAGAAAGSLPERGRCFFFFFLSSPNITAQYATRMQLPGIGDGSDILFYSNWAHLYIIFWLYVGMKFLQQGEGSTWIVC